MIKKITCIECPKSCSLFLDIENCRLVRLSGNQCPRGEAYARAEVEDPKRVLTGTVVAQGLSLKMVPVRTSQPVPKGKILEAAAHLRRVRITKPKAAGDVIIRDYFGMGVDLVATRGVF